MWQQNAPMHAVLGGLLWCDVHRSVIGVHMVVWPDLLSGLLLGLGWVLHAQQRRQSPSCLLRCLELEPAATMTHCMDCPFAAHRGGPALLAKVLGVWSSHLQRDADERGADFNGRPFFRIAVGCIQELSPSSRGDSEGIAYLATIAHALLDVQPLRVPGFTFPWLELVSHRCGFWH